MSSFKELLKQINEPSPEPIEEEFEDDLSHDADFLPLSDDLTNLILMHRNAHFGGKFEFMLEYYQSEGPGCLPDFEIEEIQKLAEMEQGLKQDLALIKLSKTEHEKVKNVLELYKGLRKLHSSSQDKNSIPTLLADLILTEEMVPQREMQELAKNEKALTYLVDLLTSEEFTDPLFPGYGRSPMHVATCLGMMGSEKAIVPLFESIKEENISHEEEVLSALQKIGKPAFDFLIQVLKNKPFTIDNEKAAICLVHFGENEEFAKTALKLLQDFQCLNYPNLVVHLILGCLGLKQKEDYEMFLRLKDQLPNAFDPDFFYVSNTLKRKFN